MGDFYGVCALLAALMFFVLIQKFDKKFGKVEKELDEIKKRMDAFLNAQERIASDHVQSKAVRKPSTVRNVSLIQSLSMAYFTKKPTPITNTRIPILPNRFSPINFS